MNKYQTWYQNITDRARFRTLEGYTERHHVIPKSVGGNDDPGNLVNLTAREHFICHWLLTKIYTGKEKYQMLSALRGMRRENTKQQRYNTKITARVYNNLKEEWSIKHGKLMMTDKNKMRGNTHTAKVKEIIRQKNTGKKLTLEQVENLRKAKVGKKREPFSQEWLDNMSKAHTGERNGMYNKKHTDEAKEKQREKAIGRKQSAETIQRKADAVRGSKREKKLCPHCSQLIAVNTYPRFHGDQCRHRGQP